MVSFYFMYICWNKKGLFSINTKSCSRTLESNLYWSWCPITTIDKHQIQYVYIYHSEFIDIAHIPLKFYTNVTWKHQYLQTTVWHRDHSNADYIWTKHLPEADTIQSHFTNLIWCALSWFCLISRAVFLHNVCKESVLISFVHYKASGLVPWSVVKLYRTNMKCASQIDITND